MKKVLKTGPGVLSGLSVDSAHAGESVLFYDDGKLVLELELNEPYPLRHTKAGLLPGLELDPPLFFSKNITIEHADKIKIEPTFA